VLPSYVVGAWLLMVPSPRPRGGWLAGSPAARANTDSTGFVTASASMFGIVGQLTFTFTLICHLGKTHRLIGKLTLRLGFREQRTDFILSYLDETLNETQISVASPISKKL